MLSPFDSVSSNSSSFPGFSLRPLGLKFGVRLDAVMRNKVYILRERLLSGRDTIRSETDNKFSHWEEEFHGIIRNIKYISIAAKSVVTSVLKAMQS